MRSKLYMRILLFTLLLSGITGNYASAQLFFEGMVFDGMGKPLLDDVANVAVSPDGKFVYTTSVDDNAVTIFSRDVSSTPGSLSFLDIPLLCTFHFQW